MSGTVYPKESIGASYPLSATSLTGLLTRVEPILTPKLFRSRFLKGMENLFALAKVDFTDSELKDYINISVNEAEVLINTLIYSERKVQMFPMDANLTKSWFYLQTSDPVVQLNALSLVGADQGNVFTFPAAWVSMGRAAQKQLNLIPILSSASTQSVSGGEGNAFSWPYFSRILGVNWIPSFIQVDYITGIVKPNQLGQTPVVINELLGVIVTLRILSMLLAVLISTSQSLSVDGLSQSSGISPSFIGERIAFMEKRRYDLAGSIRKLFHATYYMSNI